MPLLLLIQGWSAPTGVELVARESRVGVPRPRVPSALPLALNHYVFGRGWDCPSLFHPRPSLLPPSSGCVGARSRGRVMTRRAPRVDRAAPSEIVAAPGVPDPVVGQAPRQRLAVEVRVPPGAREPADVDDAAGARGLQDDDELRDGPSPVPDGEQKGRAARVEGTRHTTNLLRCRSCPRWNPSADSSNPGSRGAG